MQGGVIRENVTFDEDGNLILIANGDKYVGDKQGIPYGADESLVSGGQRTGAMITSTQTYGPGSFEVVMKIPAFNGICTSIWLFNYFADPNDADVIHNYEIDIEVHGTTINSNGSLANQGNLCTPMFTSWVTEQKSHSDFASVANLADGKFHAYRIDWHTGDDPYVEYYIDGVLLCTQRQSELGTIPTNEMYFNIGCWFPYNWCGNPNFETDYAVVKSFKYTPFQNETADKVNCDTNESGGWLDNIAVPAKNFLACGDFDYDFRAEGSNNAWSVTDENATVANGQITFDGTLCQTVTMDCFGNTYTLTAVGSGNASIKVTYQSIVDGVEVSGEVTGAMGSPLTFTAPDNCTQLLIEIVSGGTVTIDSVVLSYANS